MIRENSIKPPKALVKAASSKPVQKVAQKATSVVGPLRRRVGVGRVPMKPAVTADPKSGVSSASATSAIPDKLRDRIKERANVRTNENAPKDIIAEPQPKKVGQEVSNDAPIDSEDFVKMQELLEGNVNSEILAEKKKALIKKVVPAIGGSRISEDVRGKVNDIVDDVLAGNNFEIYDAGTIDKAPKEFVDYFYSNFPNNRGKKTTDQTTRVKDLLDKNNLSVIFHNNNGEVSMLTVPNDMHFSKAAKAFFNPKIGVMTDGLDGMRSLNSGYNYKPGSKGLGRMEVKPGVKKTLAIAGLGGLVGYFFLKPGSDDKESNVDEEATLFDKEPEGSVFIPGFYDAPYADEEESDQDIYK